MASLRRWLNWSLVVCAPVLLLALLLRGVLPDPRWQLPTFHFYIVSLTSLVAIGLAILMAVAAGQLRDARVFFLALAFLGMAGVFLVHAMTTPGAMMSHRNPWVGFSAYASLLVGAIFLALSTVDWKPAVQRLIVTRMGPIMGLFVSLLVAYGAVAVVSTAADHDDDAHSAGPVAAASAASSGYGYGDDYGYGAAPATPQQAGQAASGEREPFAFLGDPLVSRVIPGLTLALLALVIVRYTMLYRIARLPLIAGFLASAVLLAQAQLSMAITQAVARTWYASWWEYHALMLAALCVAIGGLAAEYAQSGSLQGVVEGLLLRDTIARLQRGYTDVIVALVGAVEAKDPYTRGHTQRVAALSVLIGQELRLSPERLRVLGQAAMLHDVGKIGVPDSILNKPGGLTDEEFAVIKDHPARGHAIIKGVRSLHQEIGGVRHHHERLDGSGYPDGLAGEAIPLEARIIAVADVFDALTSSRSYRDAWPRDRALAVIDAEAGTKLDPQCVRALHRVLNTRPEYAEPEPVEEELLVHHGV